MAPSPVRAVGCGMTSSGSGIALGCTTCRTELFLQETHDDEVRGALAAFFREHDGCEVFMDVSRAALPLPRRPRA
ncbi:MAG: hypothetical protein JWM62_2240 [Frankiales bacterium]|jgi:hypothetical protein|nr:hypothetical protein [Frankiales bacterium]